MSDNGVVCSRSPRRGAAQRREICEEYERFRGTQAEFCRLHGITCGSLRYWRKRSLCDVLDAGFPVPLTSL